ncbi:selenocysteine-specific translation elongation factor [Nannocystis sp.]|uniref:selenocysteine-specific translation elongation factor n=1 Tax=Nannocystis sp. TaxID=1962667 RepID=UPI0025F7B824|nr:selenocysteine-specific translation elongation factor [Nannocystis sp.]MBK7830256.1 selenocysteine-specific translation elongation factor [Nannocystis sp.]
MARTHRALVLGTAGHIDHGKTSLVRALTGIDTDRLPEEKRRGITIELGFAAWELGPGVSASIVDVPGHEAFVRTMVAGAGGIDAVLLVVSAEDGVMPQTREHLHVCQLLGLRHGVVALTKVDRLGGDPEAVQLAVDDVRAALQGLAPGLADLPIVPCSAHSGEGLPALTAAIRKLAAAIPPRPLRDRPIVPIDRVFAVKGHGTVATGTLLSGRLDLGRERALQLIPTGPQREPRELRARALHVRAEACEQAPAGSRVALNLGNIATDELARGDVISSGPRVTRSQVCLAILTHLPHDEHPWRSGTTIELCAGTAHTTARIDPLALLTDLSQDTATANLSPETPRTTRTASTDLPQATPRTTRTTDLSPGTATTDLSQETPRPARLTVPPGATALVRLRLDAPLPLWHGQRLIVRSARNNAASRQHGHTVGGGQLLDPTPGSGRGQRPRWLALARALLDLSPSARVRALLRDAGALGCARDELERRSGVVELEPVLSDMLSTRELIALGEPRFVDAAVLGPLATAAAAHVARFQEAHPLQPGLGRAAAVGGLPGRVAPDVAHAAVAHAVACGLLRAEGDLLTRPSTSTADPGLPPQVQAVLDLFRNAGIAPPTLREIQDQVGLGERQALEALGALQRSGAIVRVSPDLSLAREHHEALVARAREHLQQHRTLDVQALKALTGLSRKFVVPFLEHLDRLQISRRQGDLRVPGPRL